MNVFKSNDTKQKNKKWSGILFVRACVYVWPRRNVYSAVDVEITVFLRW